MEIIYTPAILTQHKDNRGCFDIAGQFLGDLGPPSFLHYNRPLVLLSKHKFGISTILAHAPQRVAVLFNKIDPSVIDDIALKN